MFGSDPAALAARAGGRGSLEIERLEGLLSTWRPESDVSRLTGRRAAARSQWTPRWRSCSRGRAELARGDARSFDVTVGHSSALCTMGPRGDALPDRRRSRRRARRGRRSARPGAAARAVRALRSRRAARIDLGGHRKGYAIDRVRVGLGAGSTRRCSGFWAEQRVGDRAAARCGGLAPAPRAAPTRIRGRAHAARPGALRVGIARTVGARSAGAATGTCSTRAAESRSTRSREALVVTRDATLAEALSKALLVGFGPIEGIALSRSGRTPRRCCWKCRRKRVANTRLAGRDTLRPVAPVAGSSARGRSSDLRGMTQQELTCRSARPICAGRRRATRRRVLLLVLAARPASSRRRTRAKNWKSEEDF